MKTRLALYLLALPGGLLLLFVLLPLGSLFITTSPGELAAAAGDPQLAESLGRTFLASALATFGVLFGGLPLAYLLARTRFPGKRLVESIIDLPVVIPHTAAGVALLTVLGARGPVGKALAPFGITFTDTLTGTAAAMAFVSLPYLVNFSREAFAHVDPELELSAQVDGASAWQVARHITLPLAWRGVAAGMFMMWARGISEFGAVAILAYHPKIVPVLVFELFQGFGLQAARPAAVLLVLAALVTFVCLRFFLMKPGDSG